MSDSTNIFSQSYSDNTQTEVLANLPLNNLVLTQRSLENIVEVDELNMLLNERLSSFMTRAQVEELIKALIDKDINIDQLIRVEEDPIFKATSSMLMTKDEMRQYASKTWTSNNFLSNNALNDYATLTATQSWANSQFMKKSALDDYAKKTDLPTNYLSTTSGKTNTVESKNKFKDIVSFDKTTGNGLQLPCISVNVDENYHLNVDGSEYMFADDGMTRGPGKNITDDDLVKTHMSEQTESTVSTRILATRDWTERRFAHAGVVGGLSKEDLSALDVPVGIHGENLSVLSGNYLQTTQNKALNLSEKNGFVQAESEPKYGQAYAGTMGYCIVGLVDNHSIKLSGDLHDLYDFFYNKKLSDYPMVEVNDRALKNFVFGESTELSDVRFSIALGSRSGSMRFQIESVDTSTSVVTFRGNELLSTRIIPSEAEFKKNGTPFTEDDFINLFNNDDNGFYLVGFPSLGNIKLKNFYNQHAEGGSVRAIGKYTHAEGRDTIADVRYAHAEGSHTAAGDMAAHAEGFITYAAKRYSHAEGMNTKALGVASHAAGVGATALSSYTYVWNGVTDESNSFDKYVQPNTAGKGSYCINPADGLCGFYIGNQNMHSYMADLSSAIIRSQNPNVAASTGLANGGRSFEESLSVNAYINAGATSAAADLAVGNRWNQIGLTGFNGKIIQVHPGDVVSFKLMPWKNPIDGTSTTYQNYWSAYIKPLSSFNYNMDPNVGFNAPYLSALSANGTFAQVDMSISSEPGNAAISNDWNYFKYPINQAYPVTRIDESSANWIKTTAINGFPISSTEFELSVTIPVNTHYLYVCTKQNGFDQSYETFKINGHELIAKKAEEKSITINAFNESSPWNLRHRSLSSNNVYGVFSFKHTANSSDGPGGNYLVTHPIPCKYHDHIFVSQRYNEENVKSPIVRGVQYLDKDFNNLYLMANSANNNGFDKAKILSANGCARCTLSTVTPVQFKDCAYVRLIVQEKDPAWMDQTHKWVGNTLEEEFPNDSNLSGKNATMVQIVHESEYSSPGYKFKDHDHFIPFIKDTASKQDALLVPEFYGKKLVFFGDSITRNSVSATNNDTPTRGDSSSNKEKILKGYVNYVSEALRCSYTNLGDGADTAAVQIDHDQLTGNRTSLAWRLDNLSTGGFPASLSASISAADAAFILIGTNDWTYTWTDFGNPDGTDVNNLNFCGAIRKIQQTLDFILDKSAPIVFCTPIKRKRFGTAGADIHQDPNIEYDQQNGNGKTLEDYAEAIKKICNGKRRTYVIDLYNLCPFDPKLEVDREKYMPDGTHPLSRGHKLIADFILKKFKQIATDVSFDY